MSTLDLSALPRTALLATAEAATALDIKPETLANWRCTGRYALPFVRIGRLPKYRVGDLLDFIERRTRTHTGQTTRPMTTTA